ncbi:sensor histidine kinase [Deinococcus detaillensis]|uniref:sensor histidine kinase n=1 Tax=Deinococcus detaillensis TaxID=2592048 RepID=UPI001CDCBA6A|nr:HAMP domain-containing sensor histidine kinase [Deinococcus detaillensis]
MFSADTSPPSPVVAAGPLEWSPSQRAVTGMSAALIGLTIAADLLTPASWVVGTLLSAPVALSALGGSRKLIWSMVGLALLGNLLAGLSNALREGLTSATLVNRSVSMLAALLVGLLSLRAQTASARAARFAEEERRLTRERGLRTLIQTVSGPYGQADFVRRAAGALEVLSGAARVDIGEGSAEQVPDSAVWLSHFTRPRQADLPIRIERPQVGPEVLSEAVRALQPLLERTTLLDDLDAQKSLLSQQSEVMRDLIYAFSHDLRTPIMANTLNMQSALRGAYGPLPEDYRRTLGHGLEANETLLSLADQLLLLAKYEGGEAEEFLSVELRSLSLSVLSQLEERAEAKQLTFQTDLTELRVLGRRHDLRRAIQNLLDNAVKFSPTGGTIYLSLHAEADRAVLTVSDQGPGVPPSRQAGLFQRFRGSGAGAGSGLGLYLTRRILEVHGGAVEYCRSSPPDPRSCFSLSLPLELPKHLEPA